MTAIDFDAISKGAKIAESNDFPAAQPRTRRVADPALVSLVRTAQKDGKRRDLAGRFSLMPYEGRKNACETYTVIAALHAADREVGCKVSVRRLDPAAADTGLTFKVAAWAAPGDRLDASRGGPRFVGRLSAYRTRSFLTVPTASGDFLRRDVSRCVSSHTLAPALHEGAGGGAGGR